MFASFIERFGKEGFKILLQATPKIIWWEWLVVLFICCLCSDPLEVFFSDLWFKCVVTACFRDEHIDWVRFGTWAKDSRGCTESLSEVKRLGQRYPNFGSCEGERKGTWEKIASQSLCSQIMVINGFYCLFPQDKAGPHKDIYPYVIQELRPTLNELGISTPEELGIDKI